MKLNTIYQYLILLHCVTFIICVNYYAINAPGVIKSHRKYTVAVTLYDSNAPCTISISILGNLFNASDQVELQPLETKNLYFFPPKLDRSDYKLLARGLSGCEFRNESLIYSDELAGPKIYMQTDKYVYKPLDLVQFRVVILDEHTRPLNISEPIRVEIFDTDQNRVKQFKNIALTKGVFTSKFKLSQQPVVGKWEIRTTLSGKYSSYHESKRILVKQYTLPRFSVYVDTPEHFILNDPIFRAEIYGKYTFDRYVEGNLHVELRRYSNGKVIQEQFHHIDGLLLVEFQLQNVTNINREPLLLLNVVLEEKYTGIKSTVTRDIEVRRARHTISIPYHEIEYRNNKPFRLRAHINDRINGPVWDRKTPATLKHGSKKYTTYLNDEGTAVFEFDHQADESYTVMFKDAKEVLPSFQKYLESEDDFYCKLKLKEPPRLGKPVEVEVRSTANIPYLVYTVVGHSSIVQMKFVKVKSNRMKHTIKITPSIEMIPISFLYVHYVLDGNLRYKELPLEFPLELENPISIEAPKQVKPGKEVTLKVKAEPKSYVSILAVDLGVYLLEHSYDIYKSRILEDLDDDRSYVHDSHIGRPGVVSGLITLTNAHHPIYDYDFNYPKAEAAGPLDFRKKFPETWIFDNYEINNTDTEIVLNIPDVITTWRITAFSNHDIKGFGVVDGPTDITTFLPFFISLNLPFKVKRGEIVAISAIIFNYHNQTADTDVTLYNDHMQFQFMEPLSKNSPRDQQTKNIQIPANGTMSVKFLIKPMRIGEIEIRTAANSSLYADGVVQYLNVVPEGITKYQNRARYLSAADKKSSLYLDIPPNSVNDSEIITLSVGGDFMIPSLENINKLVNLPTGSGEQNMVNFAPNILILEYLKATGKLSQQIDLVKKAKLYADVGYQQEVSYRHKNGGYSAFGIDKSQAPSTWLTAYVIRFFIKASKFVPIESRIINSGMEYLAGKQKSNGRFLYTGYLFYEELQNKYGLTAFVLLTFLEHLKYSRRYQAVIDKGLDYISSNLDRNDDVYSLSIIAAALSKAKHPSAGKVMEKLQDYRKEDENGLMWWGGVGNDVEITAYVSLALLNLPGNHLPVLKWLIEQQNSKGGFTTSHDTVVGLEALVKFAQKYNNASSWNMKISYSAQDHEGNEVKLNEFLVTKTNALKLQQHEVPKSVRRVNFEITGTGYSLVQLSSQFNVKTDSELKYFIIQLKPTTHNSEDFDLEVCFTYQALNEMSNSTNMVIMETNMPSGFKTDPKFKEDLMENDFIQRIDYENDETTMILYIDGISTDEKLCVTIKAFRANEVVDPKPAAIVMYDYYKRNRTTSLFYTI